MAYDMKKIAEEVKNTSMELQRELPEYMHGWKCFTATFQKEGALTKRERELIAVALSISKQCHWCVAYHVEHALKVGASRKEILEAAFESVIMGGGPVLVHMRMVLDALNDFKD
jgi:AhpD family alkylhydroperoxidase